MPYQMKSGKWRAEKVINGQRKTRSFPTKAAAKRWEASQTQEAWEKEASPIPTVCLLDFLTAYLKVVEEKYCRKTFNEKALAARIALKVVKPDTPVQDITTIQAEAILRLAAQTSGYAANKARKNLAAAWQWGKRLYDLPPANPFQQAAKYPADQHPRRVPSMEEFWQVYRVADQLDRVFLLFLLHTGARVGEAFRLQWSDIDFENGRVRLGTYKTGGAGLRYDWLPMTSELAEAMAWLRRQCPFRSHVFAQKTNGEPYTSRQHLMPQLCQLAGITPFGFHGIRHLAATALAYAGLDLPTIQTMLRHTSPATTARYIRSLGVDRGKIEAVFEKMKSAKVVSFALKTGSNPT